MTYKTIETIAAVMLDCYAILMVGVIPCVWMVWEFFRHRSSYPTLAERIRKEEK